VEPAATAFTIARSWTDIAASRFARAPRFGALGILAALAAVITAPEAGVPVEATGWLLAFPLLTLALLATRGMYRGRSGLRFLEDFARSFVWRP
jgi:hypothetical protein